MATPSTQHTLIDGRWYRQTFTDLGPQNTVAERLAAAAFTRVPQAFDGHNLALKDGRAYVGVKMRTLRLDTFYRLVEGAFIPVFRNTGTGEQRLQPVFTLPDNIEYFLGISAIYEAGMWRWLQCINFVQMGDRTYRMPLPNIHADSRVCMGSGYAPNKPTLKELVDLVISNFVGSTWNTDLANDGGERIDRAQRLFRCDADGVVQPVTITADDLFPVVHPLMEYFIV